MHHLLLSALIAASGSDVQTSIKHATIQSTCDGSKIAYAIGTGNISHRGNLDTPSTSVINIWAFLPNRGGFPTAWLFKRAVSDYYIQFAPQVHASTFRDIDLYWRYFQNSHSSSDVGPWEPVKVSADQIISIENILGARGIVRYSCFLSDYRM